jgi:hypothetical protein
LQNEVDRIVATCGHAGNPVFKVQSDKLVIMSYEGKVTPPTDTQIESFGCVMTKLQKLPGVQIGALGNEEDAKESK